MRKININVKSKINNSNITIFKKGGFKINENTNFVSLELPRLTMGLEFLIYE